MEEGTIAKWLVRAGDRIKPGDVRLRGVFNGIDFDVYERRQLVGLEAGDVLECRLVPYAGALHFSIAWCFHPHEASRAILAQAAAQELGVSLSAVTVQLGDSALPPAPVSYGSMTAASVTPAVLAAARDVVRQWKALAVADPQSPLYRLKAEELTAGAGVLQAAGSARRETLAALLQRKGQPSLVGESEVRPEPTADDYAVQSFGAQFSEVHVDPDTGEVRVARHISVLDAGQVLNPQTAQSQGYGGVVMGIGMALLEQTLYDPRSGAPLNSNFADYLVPTCADVGAIQIHFVGPADPAIGEPGARGIGELVLAGVAPAIVNAVYHATGVRVRELPLTPDKLLSRL